jgi:hypothetical protein
MPARLLVEHNGRLRRYYRITEADANASKNFSANGKKLQMFIPLSVE